MTSLNYSIEMNATQEQCRELAKQTGGWQDTTRFHMESKPRLAMFKKAARAMKLEIGYIEESKYSDYGEELYTKVVYP